MSKTFTVVCPTCRTRGPWLEGDFRPFCSERCRLIDLGAWFDGRNSISEPLRPEHFTEFADLDGTDLDRPDTRDLR